ncbi:type I phosphomannose isomerase catalytic subunit [Kordia periserrulae]|nr:type I phosphomannose isomerase catalytic subunit [Kordia periserrulae]
MTFYPLQFQPLYKYRMWGGEKLKTVLNKNYDAQSIGESWEISDVEGDETNVINGQLQGYTLKKLIKTFGGDFLGQAVFDKFGEEFPLLIKFIDAKTPLSIQVHPHDSIAKERHDSFGKNEMWYVMDADENAEIIVGFKKTTDKFNYSKALSKGNVLELLNTLQVTAGDTFYIPTGRVHAIGAGVLLAEIQQTSDVTYRIYDYNRVDKATGETRELHNDLATDVIDFVAHDSYKTSYEKSVDAVNTLVHTPYFKTNILFLEDTLNRDYTAIDSFVIYICTKGNISITAGNHEITILKGQSILLPAALKHVHLKTTESSEIIEVFYE